MNLEWVKVMADLKQKLQLQMYLLKMSHLFFLQNDFLPISSPKIVPFKDDEEDHLIKVQITGRPEELFLSRSPQLYKEIACLNTPNGKVYEIGPVFRGEPFGLGRRANEFIGIDVEIKTERLEDVLSILQRYLFFLIESTDLINYLHSQKLNINLPDEILTIDYCDALHELKTDTIDIDEERKLSLIVNRNSLKNRWIFLINFPAKSRGFYKINGDKTHSFDLIGGWEICSGGLRRQDVDDYFSLLNSIGWSTREMELYAKIKKENKENTGGFGIGLERLAGTIINELNIGNIQPYKRIPEEKIEF